MADVDAHGLRVDRERVVRTLTFWLRPEFVLRVVKSVPEGRRVRPRDRPRRRRAPRNLLPLALLVVFTLRKVPPFLTILGAALFASSWPA